MRYFSSIADVPADVGPSAVTFGKFDGVHLGHRAVLGELIELAGSRGLTPTVLTFDRNPLSVLAPDRCPPSVVSRSQRRESIEALGVQAMLEVAFDEEFSRLPAERFVTEILVAALRARLVLVGPHTRFGVGGAGTASMLEELGLVHGFEVVRHELVASSADVPVSSTLVRSQLAAGDVAAAAAALGRAPVVRGYVVHGEHRGRELGYPTANLERESEGLIPADGVYAGYLVSDGIRMPAAVSVGDNPTFDGVPARQVEAYVIDEDLDLYGRLVEIEFVERLRGQEKFDSLPPLIEQMADDVDRARNILAR